MRFLKILGLGLAIVLAGCSDTHSQTAADDNAAATWHFAGSAQLTNNPNFDNVKKILTLAPSLDFKNLTLDRFSAWLGGAIFSSINEGSASPLRPLLDDMLSAESIWALGGASNGPLNFIVALRLDDKHAQVWQAALPRLAGTPGASFKAQDFTGQQWKLAGGQSLWLVRAKDWLLAGSGNDLRATQTQYLQQVSQKGRPGPALNQSWLEADLDWPRLIHWLPNFPHILQPARIKATFTSDDQSLYLHAKVTYPKPMPWKSQAWRIPTRLVRDPLISFSAGQDIAAYMDPAEPLSQLTDNPLAGQFYVWALGEMVFQSYAAWPVADATNSIERIGTQATAAFNPGLERTGGGELGWFPEDKTLRWTKLNPLMVPILQVAPETNGQYLMASFFPLNLRNKPAPNELFQHILGHTNLVYYDWELTGQRLAHWRLLSGMLPVLPKKILLPPSSNSANPPPVGSTNNAPPRPRAKSPLIIVENWLSGVTPMLMAGNTATEITRTGPAELTIVRQAPFAVNSLELVLLSHWFTGTGSPGVNRNLLPPAAKVTGPGINPKSP